MIGLNSQTDDGPLMFIRHLLDDVFQPVAYRPYQHLPAPLWAPDDVVHDKMDGVPAVLILHADSRVFFNSVCKSEGPYIPWALARGCMAHFL